MRLLKPDAFFQTYGNKKAAFECLKSFRRFYPDAYVYLVSDGGDDLSDVAKLFCCEYQRLERLGPGPLTPGRLREWLRRFTYAARRATSGEMILFEDDVLIRGEIRRDAPFSVAGPYHGYARLPGPLFDELRRRHPHLTSDHYGGCGGSMLDREIFLDCAERLDFHDPVLSGSLDGRAGYSDMFLTLIFLVQGHPYVSLEDVYCEATFAYPGWETNGRPIVHQYKRFYGQELGDDDRGLLGL